MTEQQAKTNEANTSVAQVFADLEEKMGNIIFSISRLIPLIIK